MKKIPVIFLMLLVLVSCHNDLSFDIDGVISGVDGNKIYLEARENSNWVKIDSLVSADGHFRFNGFIDHPEVRYLRVEGKKGFKMFFLENGHITVSGSADTLYNLSVKGSSTNDEFMLYSATIDSLFSQNSELFDKVHESLVSDDKQGADLINRQRLNVLKEVADFQVSFIRNNLSSYIAPFVLRSVSSDLDFNVFSDLLDSLDRNLSDSEIYKELRLIKEKREKLTPGNKAPMFTQDDSRGNTVSLADVIGEGPVLIEFWASWCSACREENIQVEKLYNEYKSKGFRVVGISLDSSSSEWKDAINDDKLTWINLSDLAGWNNEVAMMYNVNRLPWNYLIDREGDIISVNLRPGDIEAVIERQ